MCYSAEASFLASAVLAGTGVAITRLHPQRASLPIAAIPAIFAAHQFSEGLIWLDQGKVSAATSATPAVFIYIFIAFVFWPVFVPLAVSRTEHGKWRRSLILACQVIGLAVGINYLWGMLHAPVSVSADCCSLAYQVQAPVNLGPLYLVAVSLPFLLSSQRGLVYFGMGILLAFSAAYYLAALPDLPSLWCFFAAILSASLYVYFRSAAGVPLKLSPVRVLLGR
jgi:hypothetical protein